MMIQSIKDMLRLSECGHIMNKKENTHVVIDVGIFCIGKFNLFVGSFHEEF